MESSIIPIRYLTKQFFDNSDQRRRFLVLSPEFVMVLRMQIVFLLLPLFYIPCNFLGNSFLKSSLPCNSTFVITLHYSKAVALICQEHDYTYIMYLYDRHVNVFIYARSMMPLERMKSRNQDN